MTPKFRFRYHKDGSKPHWGGQEIFVFGSNLAGVHGAGAAQVAALEFGAQWAKGAGRMGNSYAIPTKDRELRRLPLIVVRDEIDTFIAYAKRRPNERYFVTRIGCGLAGFRDDQIAPFFTLAPENCSFATQWQPYLEDVRIEWQRPWRSE